MAVCGRKHGIESEWSLQYASADFHLSLHKINNFCRSLCLKGFSTCEAVSILQKTILFFSNKSSLMQRQSKRKMSFNGTYV